MAITDPRAAGFSRAFTEKFWFKIAPMPEPDPSCVKIAGAVGVIWSAVATDVPPLYWTVTCVEGFDATRYGTTVLICVAEA
jgi:hypothetical protein